MLPWQPFLAFYIWGAHWRHLKNTTEPFVWRWCGLMSNYFDHLLDYCYFMLSVPVQLIAWKDVPAMTYYMSRGTFSTCSLTHLNNRKDIRPVWNLYQLSSSEVLFWHQRTKETNGDWLIQVLKWIWWSFICTGIARYVVSCMLHHIMRNWKGLLSGW